MADFEMNSFLNEYKSYNNRQYTAAENGKAAMEARDIERAKEAVQQENFLGLTLSEKLNELGIGKRVVQQLGETATNLVLDIVNPIGEYLEKYENIFDQRVYHAEIQSYAKQMFFSSQAMSAQAAENPAGQNFVYDM
jgi:hypothetical protein